MRRVRATRYQRIQQERARIASAAAVRHGLIPKLDTCERCGTKADPARGVRIEGHHPSYRNPFRLEWLCVPCHRRLHSVTPIRSFFSKTVRGIPARDFAEVA